MYSKFNFFMRYDKLLKVLVGIVVIIILTLFTSGNFSNKKVKYQYYDNFKTPTIIIEYTYSGNNIISQKTIISTVYNSRITKSNARKTYSGLSTKYKKINGIKTEIKYEEGVIFETITVNYNKVSNSDLKKYSGRIEKGELPKSKPVNLKETEKTLEKHGFIDSATSFQSKEKENK